MTGHTDTTSTGAANESLAAVSQALTDAVGDVRWSGGAVTVVRGRWAGGHRLVLGWRDEFVHVLCGGVPDVGAAERIQLNAALPGPLRVAQRRACGGAHLTASWPADLSATGCAALVATGLRLVTQPAPVEPQELPLPHALQRRLQDTVAATSDRFSRVQAEQTAFEFVIGRGKQTMQVRATQPHPEALSLATLVTNRTAEHGPALNALAATTFLLNRRLKWARLVPREDVVEAEVTMPAEALTTQVWHCAKQALRQAGRLRDILKTVQEPIVAGEVTRCLLTQAT